jgi:hypothetical protein
MCASHLAAAGVRVDGDEARQADEAGVRALDPAPAPVARVGVCDRELEPGGIMTEIKTVV